MKTSSFKKSLKYCLATCLSLLALQTFAMGSKKPKPSKPSKPETPVKPTPTPAPVPQNPTADLPLGVAGQQIAQVALNSSCAKYSWKDRGRAPAAYISGLALTYGKSLCRLRESQSSAQLLSVGTQNTSASKDALIQYAPEFKKLKVDTAHSGPETLKALYALGFGLGMRESSGKHCEGWDKSADHYPSANEAEAGLFQTSYNAVSADPELKKLLNDYRSKPNSCFLEVFSKNVKCKEQALVGEGDGRAFQAMAKSCPAFASEFALITLRVLRKHYGPINLKKAEVQESCVNMLDQVEDLVQTTQFCSEISF